MVKIKFSEIIPNIFWFNFDTQEECAKTFCRFEEYYESPFWQGKIFTLDEYKEWYIKTYGQWSYYTDWSGFNIPDYAFKPFFDGKFRLYEWMIKKGYTISSALDELHAYILEYEVLPKRYNISNLKLYEKVGKLLQENFN